MDSRSQPPSAASPPDPDGFRAAGLAVAPKAEGRGVLDPIEKIERLERELVDLKTQERAALNEALRLREQLRRLGSARLVRFEQRLQRLVRSALRRLRRDGLFSRRMAEERKLVEASGLFDTRYYLRAYPDVAAAEADPILHYLRHGAAEGRNPSAVFSTLSYAVAYPDVAGSGMNPLVHYILIGKAEGRSALTPTHPARGGNDRAKSPPILAAGSDRPPFMVPVSTRSQPRIAVVLHLFYLDLWPEIARRLSATEEPFDLIVTVPKGRRRTAEETIQADMPTAQVLGVENRGRDIGPFLELLGSGRLDRYDYLCKIHGKKSPHREDGNEWRRDLLEELLGDAPAVRHLIDWLDANPGTGVVGPSGRRYGDDHRWGSNEAQVRALAKRAGLAESDLRVDFFAGSMFWCRSAALAPLKSLKLKLADFEPEQNQIDGTMAHALERLFLLAAGHAGFAAREIREVMASPLPASPLHAVLTTDRGPVVKTIAFYLPQFHPIAENDGWWGRGFTEWNNVARTKPMYDGHLQPRLPADFGFYDLRMPQVQEAQAKLASAYGIHGFCYYYYWFRRRRLLETPIMQMLHSGRPDFPFCICWANENWTRRWDGLDHEVLVEQDYGSGFAQDFIDEMIPFMRDPRYIRYEGRPVLLIYRAKTIPDLPGTIALWRDACREAGLGEIHLCAVKFWDVTETRLDGFDALVEFPPHRVNVVEREVAGLNPAFRGNIYDYGAVIDHSLSYDAAGPDFPARRGLLHRGLMMGWDNSARRGPGANIFDGATPELFGFWLNGLLEQERRRASPESLIFINAWNEWAEGTVLEPDLRHGRGYLEATRDALMKNGRLRWGEAAPLPHKNPDTEL
jgi:lipopolysaccharide biosynthesis protein